MVLFDKKLKYLNFLLFIIIFTFSCAKKQTNLNNSNIEKPTKVIKKKSKNDYELIKIPEKKPYIPPPPPMPIDLIPDNTQFSILDEKRITLNALNAPLKVILYSIASDLSMNLVVAPDIDLFQIVTVNFENVLARHVLDVLKDMVGINFEIKGNILYVKSTITKTFHIPYIQSKSKYDVSLGGDVLGGGDSGGGSGGSGGSGGGANLSGNFALKFANSEDIDFYKQLEKNIKKLLSPNGNYVLNKMAGILIVKDKVANVKEIEKFLNKLKNEITKGVLIEAKVIEVSLNKDWSYGIDWSYLLSNKLSFTQNLSLQSFAGQLVISNTDFQFLLNALAETGKIETLSNPRIRVLNGQSALISTGTVTPYWQKEIDTLSTQSSGQQQVTYNQTSVLDGILLGVAAFINDDGSITLNIIPVSTEIRGEKKLIDKGEVVAQAPIIELKEAGTIVRVKDGDTVIIGGLISNSEDKSESKVPLLGDIPYLGDLFKTKTVKRGKKELIILLKPHIIRGI